MKNAPRSTVWIAILGVLAVVLYAVVAGVNIFVLNPLAAVPGSSLRQIYWEVEASQEGGRQAFSGIVLATGCVLALVVAAAVIRARLSPNGALILMLTILAMGAPAYVIASTPMRLSVAHAHYVNDAELTPWPLVLYGVSALSGLAVVVLAVVRVVTDRVRPEQVAAQ